MKYKIIGILIIFLVLTKTTSAQPNSKKLVTIIETGTAQLGDKTKIQTKDAAKTDAMRKAVERAAGVYLESSTEIKDFILQTDEIQTSSKAYIRSVREIEYNYDKQSETGSFKGEFVIDLEAMNHLGKTSLSSQTNNAKSQQQMKLFFAFYDSRGKRLNDGDVVYENDQYQIMVQPFQKCYVYILNLDASGAVYSLFPRDEILTSNPLSADREYYFPDGNNMYAFDDVTGIEQYFIIASHEPMQDVDFLLKKIKELGGNTSKDLAQAVVKRAQTRGGGKIINKYSGKTVSKKSIQDLKIAIEVLESEGSVVRHITLNHKNR